MKEEADVRGAVAAEDVRREEEEVVVVDPRHVPRLVHFHHLLRELLVHGAVRAPLQVGEGVVLVGQAQLAVEDGAEVGTTEAVVEVLLQLRAQEDDDAVVLLQEHVGQGLLLFLAHLQGDAPHPLHVERKVERELVEHRVVVPFDSEAPAFCALDVQRQLVGDQDGVVGRLELCWDGRRDCVLRLGLLRLRELQESAQRRRYLRALQCADHIRQVTGEARLARLDDFRGVAIENVPPEREASGEGGQVGKQL
mmetsp:Transcript_44853/g.102986  ORF Transcript_44853/g.102986 Transcript_44853/m.102986 type:complete len:252 (-) Transcript_44853:217-972(-)